MTTVDLRQRVTAVTLAAQRLVRLNGVGWFVAFVCLTAILFGGIDYYLRFQDRGIRIIWSLLCGAALTWAFVHFILASWRYRCSLLAAARKIEHLYPQWGDNLTNAVAFANVRDDNSCLGSADMCRAVIADVQSKSAGIDFLRVLDARPSKRAWTCAGLLMAVLVALIWADVPSVTLAGKRLLMPWRDLTWPRRHVLQWSQAPRKLAIGQDFEAQLIDTQGHLPAQVEIHYWYAGDRESDAQTFVMQPLGDVLSHRMASITRPFQYRATGGDDQAMPWIQVALVEPPRIIECEVLLDPPTYTQQEPSRVEGDLRAWEGTRATLRGRANKRLSSVLLETNTSETPTTLSLTLGADDREFALPPEAADWTIVQSGSYALRLVDGDGLDVGIVAAWDVEAIHDSPPTVSLKEPAEDVSLTPTGQLTLSVIVKDDLGVQAIQLRAVRTSPSGQYEQVYPLWRESSPVIVEQEHRERSSEDGVQRTLRYVWDLSQLPAIGPDEWIDFNVAAVDDRSQWGESATRRLVFESPDDLEERIAQRQSAVLSEVAEIVQLQRDTRTQTVQVTIQVRETGRLDQQNVDQLHLTELNQRQVQQRLTHPQNGVVAELASLIAEVQSNRLNSPALLTRLQRFHDTLADLEQSSLAPVQDQLIDAVKFVRESPRDAADDTLQMSDESRQAMLDTLERTDKGQQQIIATLEQLLGQLTQWDNYQRLTRDVSRLQREQENIYKRTEQLRGETLTKDLRELTAQQRARLQQLAQQQNDIGIQFSSLASRIEAMRERLEAENSNAATALASAIELIEGEALETAMRDVARAVQQNRLGQVADQQEQVISALSQLHDVLANRRRQQHARSMEEELMIRVRLFLAQALVRQSRLIDETRQAAAVAMDDREQSVPPWRQTVSRLAGNQITLGREVEELQSPLADLTAFSNALQQVSSTMRLAGERLETLVVDTETVALQQEALTRLQYVHDAIIQNRVPDNQEDPNLNSAGEPQESQGAPYLLPQLRLVRQLQHYVNQQTKLLSDQVHSENADVLSRKVKLVQEQGRLAEIVTRLLELESQGQTDTAPPPAEDPWQGLEDVLELEDGVR